MIKNKDLTLAVRLRDVDGYAIAVAKENEVLYKSKGKGIYPLYNAYRKKIDFCGASAADKVIGKGAAMLFAELDIKEINTIVISKPALKYLLDNDIMVSYTNLVDYISNRNKDGKCPVETMADASSNFKTFLADVEEFLKKLEII